jgi:multicomponent Na+:H+ antiporter subunit E
MPALYLFVTVAGLWLIWSGHYTPLILSLGLASTAGVVLLCWRMRILDRDIAPLHVVPATARYVPWLAWEVVKSNLDVIRRVLDPKLPIDPQILRVTASQATDLGRVTYTNSITLTPGTLTIDAIDDHLTVHAIADEPAAGLRDGAMDRKITSLEPD